MKGKDWRSRGRRHARSTVESGDWRREARRATGYERIDARPACPSGTIVCALLSVAVPLPDIASACGVSVEALRTTVVAGRRLPEMGAEVLNEAACLRLGAFLGIVAARGLPEALDIARAEAWAVGVVA